MLSFSLCWINHSLGFPLARVLHPGALHLYFHRDFHPDKVQCSADGISVRSVSVANLTRALQEEASHHQHHAPAILLASHCKYPHNLYGLYLWHFAVKLRWLPHCSQQAAKALLTFLVASRLNVTSRLWSYTTRLLRTCSRHILRFKMSETWNLKVKIFCRLFFAWCLFVWQLLSPRWTVTPSTFTLSTGSTETQSTGAAISSSTHPLWLIYFEFFRPYGFGSWGVGSAGFGKKMTVASRPNSLYGGYSFWSILNLNFF